MAESWAFRIGALCATLVIGPSSLEGQAARFVGCYDVTTADLSTRMAGDSLFGAPPTRVQLDTLPGLDWRGPRGYRVLPAPGGLPSIHRYAFWEPLSERSLRLRWTTGMAGVTLDLIAEEDGVLRGAANYQADYEGSARSDTAEAAPVSCTAPPQEAWQAYPRFPREVEFERGRRITLGEPLPEGLPWTPETGLLRIDQEPREPFQGAAVRAAMATNGVVRSIWLHYPEGTDVEALRRRLGVEYGERAWRPSTFGGRQASWSGRFSSMELREIVPSAGGLGASVLLTDRLAPEEVLR